MVGLARTRTLRDVALIFLGAAAMHFTTSFVGPLTDHTSSIVVKTQVSIRFASDQVLCDEASAVRGSEAWSLGLTSWKQRKKGMGPGAGELFP